VQGAANAQSGQGAQGGQPQLNGQPSHNNNPVPVTVQAGEYNTPNSKSIILTPQANGQIYDNSSRV